MMVAALTGLTLNPTNKVPINSTVIAVAAKILRLSGWRKRLCKENKLLLPKSYMKAKR